MISTLIQSELESREPQLQKLKERACFVDQLPDEGVSKEYHKALLGVDISELERCEGAKIAGEALLHLYRTLDTTKARKPNKRPKEWRKEVEEYYNGHGYAQGLGERVRRRTWCHATGAYLWNRHVEATHIVPFFLNAENLGNQMFGSRAVELDEPNNALLLQDPIKSWFDRYFLVIIPVDRTEIPITRWKILPMGSTISPKWVSRGFTQCWIEDQDPEITITSRELTFLNEARPASRFLYFHFIMALVRARDADMPGWKEEWARYFTEQPFPTPGSYLRNSMLGAINQRFGVTDAKLIENWLQGQGVEAPIELSPCEAEIVASRVKSLEKSAQMEEEDEEEEDEEEEDEEEKDEKAKDQEKTTMKKRN
ncbi:hypothetical protein GGS24DRAFT_492989 [Hypoxylon argillaceum]|nr:hypothetical protein GGS24DRAFT_492989 [Hypoxylon argillaceum]